MADNILTKNADKFVGRIRTLTLAFPIEMLPTGRSGNNPAYDIFSGGIKIGSAWEKTMQQSGEYFYSLTMDDPSFPATLNMAAFPSKGDGQAGCYDVVWSRPRAREAA